MTQRQPETRPRDAAAAALRFRCGTIAGILTGKACAGRWVPLNTGPEPEPGSAAAIKRRISPCTGCQAGAARAVLLGLVPEGAAQLTQPPGDVVEVPLVLDGHGRLAAPPAPRRETLKPAEVQPAPHSEGPPAPQVAPSDDPPPGNCAASAQPIETAKEAPQIPGGEHVPVKKVEPARHGRPGHRGGSRPRSPDHLTDRHRQVLVYVAESAAHGSPFPSLRDLARQVGGGSSSMLYVRDHLVGAGLLEANGDGWHLTLAGARLAHRLSPSTVPQGLGDDSAALHQAPKGSAHPMSPDVQHAQDGSALQLVAQAHHAGLGFPTGAELARAAGLAPSASTGGRIRRRLLAAGLVEARPNGWIITKAGLARVVEPATITPAEAEAPAIATEEVTVSSCHTPSVQEVAADLEANGYQLTPEMFSRDANGNPPTIDQIRRVHEDWKARMAEPSPVTHWPKLSPAASPAPMTGKLRRPGEPDARVPSAASRLTEADLRDLSEAIAGAVGPLERLAETLAMSAPASRADLSPVGQAIYADERRHRIVNSARGLREVADRCQLLARLLEDGPT